MEQGTQSMRLTVVTAMAAAMMASEGWAAASDWDGEAELGVLITSGNTEETNINGRLGVKHEVVKWRNTLELSSFYSEGEDETTAEEYRAAAATNYKFDEQQYWFLRGSYEDDRFSGYDFEATVTTGYGNRVWQEGERSFLDLSAGAGYRYNKLKEANKDGEREEEEPIVRLAGQLDYELSESALFRQILSTEVGTEDGNTISHSETSLQAAINSSLSMKVAFRVKHVSDEPEGSEDTDTETVVSLLYGF